MDFTEAYSDRCSAAGLAARRGDAAALRELVAQGYSIDVPDNRGWVPLHEAAAHDSAGCLRLLLQAAPSDDYLNSKTFEGMCALHLSARYGSLESVRVLLEAGADPNEVTTEATTPLFLGDASCQNNPSVGKSLFTELKPTRVHSLPAMFCIL